MKKYLNNNYNNILIIRLSSMGDVILTSHLVRLVKERFPLSQISFIVAAQHLDAVDNNPYITKVIKYDKTKNIFEINNEKKERFGTDELDNYDLIIDLQKNHRSRKIVRGLHGELHRVNKNRLHKLSLVWLKKPLEGKDRHITELYLDAVSSLGVTDDGKGLELWLPEERGKSQYPPELKTPGYLNSINRIAIAPGAFHNTKRWPQERFAELAEILHERYGSEIILLGGPGDRKICNDIRALCPVKIADYSGALSVLDTARLVDICRLVVTNDTGVMHIAAARRVPVAAIFGSTVPAFGFTPFRVSHRIIQKELPCRPCTHFGTDSCPKKHFNCMNLITAAEVAQEVEKLTLQEENK